MRHVLVFKDVNYGASKTSATKNTALNPYDLADGALGIYGNDPTLSPNELALIIDGSSSGNLIAHGSFTGDKLLFYQGTATGCRFATAVDVSGAGVINGSIQSKAYTAPVKQVRMLGYNDTAGQSLNFPSSIDRGDEMTVKTNNLSNVAGGSTLGLSHSGYATADNVSDYSILADFLVKLYESNDRQIDADINSNLTAGSAFTNSATVALTHGSTAVTTSAAHGVGAGDWITLDGDAYKASAVPTTTTITLDRPYRGATIAAMANNLTTDDGSTAATEYGLKVTDKEFETTIAISFSDLIASATNTLVTSAVAGSGTYAKLLQMEKDFRPHMGVYDINDRRVPLPDTYSVSGTTYDMYNILHSSPLSNSDMMGGGKTAQNQLVLAFVEAADTAGKNQSDFEDIMVSFYANLATLL